MGDEIPDIPVMGQVALPGSGQKGAFAHGFRVLLEREDFATLCSGMDRAEEPRRSGPDNHNITRIHGYSPDQCRSITMKYRTPASARARYGKNLP
ncbi:MAG: hypothetical protein MZV63_46160 [Marinilabiliales bacterium]|nr:hypothetical protein [Marinilabiliales bacterium]